MPDFPVKRVAGSFSTARGDFCTADSYEPLSETMGPGSTKRFAPTGGKATNVEFPYWNVEMAGGGVLLAVGWPGQWAASFGARQ
ncbi:MAG: hypothetical protein IPN11_17055 [Opitutaceae bacterium]|nr:hypothetical protein [Opitutaceae bacterium]